MFYYTIYSFPLGKAGMGSGRDEAGSIVFNLLIFYSLPSLGKGKGEVHSTSPQYAPHILHQEQPSV